MKDPTHLQALYAGFCDTPLLWKNAAVHNLEQLHVTAYAPQFLRNVERRLRLGQLAERFVFNQLDTDPHFKILAENVQIQDQKRTVGELDALILEQSQATHLELVYKFYLYDERLGNSETQRWIGPNRRDSLEEKLNKLELKQLPLLYSAHCRPILEALQLNLEHIKQKVLFKAQLFTPYQNEVPFENLNRHCVSGFYMRPNQLQPFLNAKFYIPKKMDWFLKPHSFVEWQNFEAFSKAVPSFLAQQKSPLFWLKKRNGELLKCFLVWW